MSRRFFPGLVALGFVLSGCGPSNPFRPGTHPFPPPDPEARIPYGSQDTEDVTGAISSVPIDENQHFNDVLDMLRSQVPGLQVTELPGGDVTLRIRGEQQSLRTDDDANQPLLVIDDMPILPSTVGLALRGLVPHQIESIHVLKDVSSIAIYGSRGANGVILIHLKR